MSSDLVYVSKAAQPPAGPIELGARLPHGHPFIHRFQTGVTDSSLAHSIPEVGVVWASPCV